MIGAYLIAAGTIVLVASAGWEYYIERIRTDSSLGIEVSERANGEVDRSELPAVGSQEEVEPPEEDRLVKFGYTLAFALGILGLILFWVI